MSIRRSLSIRRWLKHFKAYDSSNLSFVAISALTNIQGWTHEDPSPIFHWQQIAWSGSGYSSMISVDRSKEQEPETVPYKITLVTGDVRGAGNSAAALLTLFGEGGESESHLVGADTSQGPHRARRTRYVLYSKDLGPLKRILIQQVAASADELAEASESGQDSSRVWYLDRVEVQGPDGEIYTFPSSSWIGIDANRGNVTSMERNLIVAGHHRDMYRSSLHDPAHRITRPLSVDANGFSIPHPDKVQEGIKGLNRKGMGHGGEDAYFYASNSNGTWALGVADGVYEWRNVGIDPGIFSRQLVEYCRQAVELGTIDVLRVLQFASKHLKRSGALGSSTICLGIIDTIQGRLEAATVGDSGFLVLGRSVDSYMATTSRGKLLLRYRSPQQEHTFGCPYQLGHHDGADSPEDAMLSTMPLYPGDVIIMGSDGLFDNLSDEEIIEITEVTMTAGGRTSEVSKALAFRAFQASTDKDRVTPYSRAASDAFEMIYNGGKADDITVVTCILD